MTGSAARAARRPWPALASRPALLIFLLSFAVRAALVAAFQPYHQPLRSEVQNIPISLITTGSYGNPFQTATGPTAHYMPLYTLLLAALFKLFGTGTGGELAQYVLNVTCSSAMYAALPGFARLTGLPVRTGIVAGGLGALLPIHFFEELRGGDMFLAAVITLASTAVLFRAAQGDLRLPRAVLTGVLAGIGALTNPAVLAPITGMFVLAAWRNRRHAGAAARFGAIVAAICCIFLAPWVVRNYRVLGAPIVLRSNLGLELQVSNNDLATPRFSDNPFGPAMKLYHPFANPREAERVRAEGEVAYNREKFAAYRQWAQLHPGRFWELIGSRFVLFWVPVTNRRGQTLALIALSVCSYCGLAMLWKRNRLLFWTIAAVWLTYPDLYYLLQNWARYRLPIQWTFLLMTAVFLTRFVPDSRRAAEPSSAVHAA